MRFITTLLIGTALALPAMAQTGGTAVTGQAPSPATTSAKPPMHRAHRMVGHTGSPGHPTATDKGPFTSEADRAYMGGGAILEGQPGGPPPPASDVLRMRPGQPLPPTGQGLQQPMQPMQPRY